VKVLDLASVLDYYGVDYRLGRNAQKVRCVIHDDRDPSMNVDFDKGVFYCHACGEGGTALALVMKKESLGYEEARTFASDHGIASGDADGGGDDVSLGYLAGRRLPGAKGNQRGKRKYVPAWRRQ